MKLNNSFTRILVLTGSRKGITKMEKATFEDIEKEVQKMIRRRLDRTEQWAREQFEGEEDIETMVYLAKAEVLQSIGDAFRKNQNIELRPLGNPNN